MVTLDFSQKVVRRLELYLLELAAYQLPVAGYDLIMLLPVAPDFWNDQRTLLVSAPAFVDKPLLEVLGGLIGTLRGGLNDEEYLTIYNVDVIDPAEAVVQRVQQYLKKREEGETEASVSLIGGTTNQTLTAIKSTVLEKLTLGQAYRVELLEATFDGQLVSIGPQSNDAVMVFDTETGHRNCLFSELVQLQPAPHAAR